ncbi:hypothetical protein MP638_006715 [Amoeboaphelidium occidentale]|nr:hypothetical protein MP638_006715 [Amoeboaphelidium occidentale]
MTCVMLLAISYNFTLTTCSDQKLVASTGNENTRKMPKGDQDRLITGPFRAQKGQDRYVYSTFFKDMDGPGIFVEFGGRDGIMDSNTYFFEKALGWKGLLVEAMEPEYRQLSSNRPDSIAVFGAVCPTAGKMEFLISSIGGWHGLADTYAKERIKQGSYKVEVECYTLDSLLKKTGFKHINYMTVDTEGSEIAILETLDTSKYVIDLIQVEMLKSKIEERAKLIQMMTEKHYVVENVFNISATTEDYLFRRSTISDLLQFEEVQKEAHQAFKNKKRFLPLAEN